MGVFENGQQAKEAIVQLLPGLNGWHKWVRFKTDPFSILEMGSRPV